MLSGWLSAGEGERYFVVVVVAVVVVVVVDNIQVYGWWG